MIIIPARMASTRFPRKPLALINGKAMMQRVWEIGKATGYPVCIATDDAELFHFAKSFGAEVVMTSPSCLTGTDRVAEAAQKLEAEIVFSLQGDAVLTPPWVIAQVLKAMEDPTVQMATPVVELQGKALADFVALKQKGSSSGTCAVFDPKGNALYFSKSLIPFKGPVFRHIGLYAYRKETLLRLSQLPESPLEKAEKLEQLRALENGIPIRVVQVDYQGRTHGSVDRPEDVAIVEEIIAREGELI
jgi:3-deoxy-manno-octulosonate cytidylyltransferase (CMP-KDO synthetase)